MIIRIRNYLLKVYSEDYNTGLQVIPAHFWPLHGVMGLQLSPLFLVVAA